MNSPVALYVEKIQLQLLYPSLKEGEICVFKIKLDIMPSYLNLFFLRSVVV